MKPLLVTSGEPAGIGPDVCLALAQSALPIVVLCNKVMLEERANQLGLQIILEDYQPGIIPSTLENHLTVLSIPCAARVVPGVLNPDNAPYVLSMLSLAATRCMDGEFAALITAPVHKAVINKAGIVFTGHTEFFSEFCQVDTVVMMLVSPVMRVALITTHLPLKKVPDVVTESLIINVITQLNISLQHDFGIKRPKIYVAGLNPHAGENGYLGREEIETIAPAIDYLQKRGLDVKGPFPADTLFAADNTQQCDVFVAMYHDQGLPVLKYASFGGAVNVTLGLPIIRTSVDHGTALELAGTGAADGGSLIAAVALAANMAKNKHDNN